MTSLPHTPQAKLSISAGMGSYESPGVLGRPPDVEENLNDFDFNTNDYDTSSFLPDRNSLMDVDGSFHPFPEEEDQDNYSFAYSAYSGDIAPPAAEEIIDTTSHNFYDEGDKNPDAPPPLDPKFKRGISALILVSFLGNLWPYIETFHGSKPYLGWCIAGYSLAQFAGSPIVGYIAEHWISIKLMIIFTLIIEFFGNILYASSPNLLFILLSRCLIGFAASNVALVRTYLSYTTGPKERTKWMSLVTLAQTAGFIVGPALAAVLSYVDVDFGHVGPFPLRFDQFTCAGWLGAFLSLTSLILISLYIRNPPSLEERISRGFLTPPDQTASVAKRKSLLSKARSSEKSRLITNELVYNTGLEDVVDPSDPRANSYLISGIVVCCILNFITTFLYGTFEAIGTPLTQDEYHWAVKENGIMYSVMAIVSVAAFLLFQYASSKGAGDRPILVGGLVFLVLGMGLLIFTKHLAIWRFILGVGLLSSTYPIVQAILYSVFSKIIGPGDQAILTGWLLSAASLARLAGPIYGTYVYDAYSGLVFIGCGALTGVALITSLFFYRSLLPHPYFLAQKEETQKRKRRESQYLRDHSTNPPERSRSQVRRAYSNSSNSNSASSSENPTFYFPVDTENAVN